MTTILQSVLEQPVRISAHSRLVHELADSFRKRFGEDHVKVEPTASELPEFLQGFRPDLILMTPGSNVVVEVGSQDRKRSVGYWEDLDRAIKGQPGWSLQLVLDKRREEELHALSDPILTQPEIEARLDAGEALADQGLLDSALVVIWSAIEAILWQGSRQIGLELSNQGPDALLTALFLESDLERSDYEALKQIRKIRNTAAHGFSVPALDRDMIDQTLQIARRLLVEGVIDQEEDE